MKCFMYYKDENMKSFKALTPDFRETDRLIYAMMVESEDPKVIKFIDDEIADFNKDGVKVCIQLRSCRGQKVVYSRESLTNESTKTYEVLMTENEYRKVRSILNESPMMELDDEELEMINNRRKHNIDLSDEEVEFINSHRKQKEKKYDIDNVVKNFEKFAKLIYNTLKDNFVITDDKDYDYEVNCTTITLNDAQACYTHINDYKVLEDEIKKAFNKNGENEIKLYCSGEMIDFLPFYGDEDEFSGYYEVRFNSYEKFLGAIDKLSSYKNK